ncbi:uncharacterized protein LOC121737866 [Aricia agestis]|uniref:uncharacterized protein LOC121737866 n=1 Tax=Aricia agestis TaxID=91739 RepID=UPI001C20A2D7|nr:uncharacterized protein LOC121737866 [Aricia agestis]
MNSYVIAFLLLLGSAIPIQLQQGEEMKENVIESSELNQCLSVRRGNEVGVCFGKELLSRLNNYDEKESFSLANGISFVRDEKTERTIGSFLDKDPMDFRAIMEDASDLISKRSLHWDLGGVYPGLVMRIGPTLANGVLEFVIDPRMKDRSYHQGEVSTGRLLARNVLVPFLLGLKFHISTLLPLLLGLLLLASKKAFFLAKIALIAVTLFSGSSGSNPGYFGGIGGFSPGISAYSHENLGHYQGHHTGGGFYRDRHTYTQEYPEKLEPTVSPITPDELRDRLERLFVTKKEDDREEKIRNARNFAWTPINTG